MLFRRLLDDLDAANERNVEQLRLSSHDDAVNHYEDEAAIACEVDDPAYERDPADEYSDDGINTKSDEKEDAVVYVMSDERAGLIGIDEEAEKPEQSDVRQDREQFRV